MKFRKKPVVIDAIQWDGSPAGAYAIRDAFGSDIRVGGGQLQCRTLEGDLNATPSDWIIRGIKGEVYPCKPDVFAASYEPADS